MRVQNRRKYLMYLAILCCFRRKYKRARKYQVHPLNMERRKYGEYFTLINRLVQYPMKFFEYFRMSRSAFNLLLQKIDPLIRPSVLNYRRDFISSKEKLVLTLRFLATGASFADLAFRFNMGRATVRKSIMQTVKAINCKLEEIVMPKQNLSSWMKISDEFLQKWNFPNCLGAVDGKHIRMFAPNNSGSMDFNYKKFFSNILMAVVDASYKFVMVTIGAHGSNADPSVFAASNFGKAWKQCPQQLKVPADRCLPGTQTPQPFVLVGDEAFGLSYNLLTPYSGNCLPTSERIFNYRLSRARRLVESAFGMLAHTWRILLKSLEVQPALGKLIVLCCCILHNYIKLNMKELKKNIREVQTHDPSAYVNHEARMAQPVSTAVTIRNSFAEWFINEGNLPFQYNRV